MSKIKVMLALCAAALLITAVTVLIKNDRKPASQVEMRRTDDGQKF